MLEASVIVSFYNDLPLLQLVLMALAKQHTGQFEVLIADDGSKPEVRQALDQALPNYPYPIKHLWHPDEGFRKTVALNRAVLAAKAPCLIFIDADCVPQAHFVDDHIRHARPGVFQTGRRVDVHRDTLHTLDCTEPTRLVQRNWVKLLQWTLQRHARNLEKGWRLPPALANKITNQISGRAWGVIGCNFSCDRDDLLAINGFDERYAVSWGAEDSDVERRLLKAGVCSRSLRYQATMVHFDASYAKRKSDQGLERDLDDHFNHVKAENRVWTPYGIIKEDRPDPVLY